MKIKKINLDGTEYEIGGSEAKLVATGTYNNLDNAFILNNNLENKLYYIKYNENISTIINAYIEDDFLYGGTGLIYIVGNIYELHLDTESFEMHSIAIDSVTNSDDSEIIDLQNGEIVEVYELPFTLGGAE